MDEKRLRLEAIRQKNALKKKELEQKHDETPSQPLQISQIIADAEAKKPVVEDLSEKKEAALKLQSTMQKYRSEGLKVSGILNDIIVVGKKKDCYEIEIQCDIEKEQKKDDDDDVDDEIVPKPSNQGYRKKSAWGGANVSAAKTKPLKKAVLPGETIEENPAEYKEEIVKTVKTLSEEQKRNIYSSEEFQTFVNRNYKYIERALCEKDIYDNFKSYYDDEEGNNVGSTSKNWISNSQEFYDENLVLKRTVTSLDWSVKHQELMLAGYSKSEEAGVNDPNGLVLLWSLAMRKKPEFTFTCQTEITCAIFHKFNPKLIIGGTYTGQILIWDTRGKALPVQKTQPGGKFHAYPIYCLSVNGSTNSNNITSISNDGVMCTWSISNLSKANKRIELKGKKKRTNDKETFDSMSNQNTEDIGAICMASQDTENNHILIGTDDSDIYQVYTHQSSENNDNIAEVYRKHSGPITSVDLHPGDIHKNTNLSHLFISTSVDWTMNLWSKNENDGPVVNFDLNDDYVYAAKWHPTNPSLFASVDGLGKLDFWDLNKDLEVPAFRHDVGKEALNKLCWSHDGKRLVTGDIHGKLSLFNIDKEHKPDDAFKLEKVLQNAKNAKLTVNH